jgi:phospholipase/carboxylesterase
MEAGEAGSAGAMDALPASTRRGLLRSGLFLAGSLLLGCGVGRRPVEPSGSAPQSPGPARLAARPRPPDAGGARVGLHPLGLDSGRDGFVFAPARAAAGSEPLPLVLMLHGAGGNGSGGIATFLPLAEEAGVILVAPDSRGRTWDVLLGGWGPDVAFVDRALEQTFTRYPVDPARIAVEGFSDGASYALGLGLANGDLFRQVLAFSPGFVPSARTEGRPSVFVSHGVADQVLPIDRCSRRIVPALEREGYDVVYREFPGGHEVPAAMAEEAFGLVTG